MAASVTERLLDASDASALAAAAAARSADPAWVPADAQGLDVDARIAGLAVTVALRRHARGVDPGDSGGVRRAGKDLRAVGLVVGSGGVLRHASAERRTTMLAPVTTDLAGGWKVPEHPVRRGG